MLKKSMVFALFMSAFCVYKSNAALTYYGGPAAENPSENGTTLITCPGVIIETCVVTDGYNIWANENDGWHHGTLCDEVGNTGDGKLPNKNPDGTPAGPIYAKDMAHSNPPPGQQ